MKTMIKKVLKILEKGVAAVCYSCGYIIHDDDDLPFECPNCGEVI